jgi:ribosomal protein S18 acetylase RimI-like enzyme
MKIRKAIVEDARGIANVQVKTWRTTYQGIVPDDYLDAMSVEEQAERFEVGLRNTERNQTFYVVEEDERGEVVGFICGGESRHKEKYPVYDGELYAIYIMKDMQGKGLGSKLVSTLVEWLKDQEYKQMLVYVLADNPAKNFYESLGAEYLATEQLEISGKKIDEYVYVWKDITQIH